MGKTQHRIIGRKNMMLRYLFLKRKAKKMFPLQAIIQPAPVRPVTILIKLAQNT